MLIELPPPADLVVEAVGVPPRSVRSGETVTVSWTVGNRGIEPATGRWEDAVYLSSDGVWDLGDVLLGRFRPGGRSGLTLAPGATYAGELAFQVPATLPQSYRLIVRSDIFDDIFEGPRNANNTAASAGTLEVTVPRLELGVPLADALSRGEALLYEIRVGAGETVQIDLDSTADGALNEIYVGYERLPSTLAHDAAFAGRLQGDQQVLIPRTEAGRYFVLVRSQETPPDAAFTLTARLLPFAITDVTPDVGGDGRYVTTTIRGAQYALAWVASDDLLGSGVQEYSVLASADGTTYTPVRRRVRESSLTLTLPGVLVSGQTRFLVRAIDAAGNVEPLPEGLIAPPLAPSINLGLLPTAARLCGSIAAGGPKWCWPSHRRPPPANRGPRWWPKRRASPSASDMAGRTASLARTIEINTAVKDAAFTQAVDDLTAVLDGVPVTITRRYSSLNHDRSGALGLGWHLAGAEPELASNVLPTGAEAEGLFRPLTTSTRVYLNLPDGRRAGFRFTPVLEAGGGVAVYRPGWTADPGVEYTLASVSARLQRAGDAFYQFGTGLPYHPSQPAFAGSDYTLTAPDGTQYRYDTGGGGGIALREMLTTGGVRLVWTSSGVVAPSGAAISLVRDAAGRITALTGPDGHGVRYTYDAQGRLVQVRDFAGDRRTVLGYDRNLSGARLTEISPSQGTGVAVQYDAAGALRASQPLHAQLPALRELAAGPITDTLAAGAVRRYALVVGERELASAADGLLTLRLELRGLAGFDPAVARLIGVPLVQSASTAGQSLGLYSLRNGCIYVLEVAASDGQSAGEFELRVEMAGDIHRDAAIDGLDSGLFASAFGAIRGDAHYLAAADFNSDGQIDAIDRDYLDRSFGFVANRLPLAAAGTARTRAGLPVEIALAALVSDPDRDPLAIATRGAVGGRLSPTGDPGSVLFVPAPGFVGQASFEYIADDGLGPSEIRTVVMQVDPANFAHLELGRRDLVLAPGANAALPVRGRFADGQEQSLPASQVLYVSTNPAVATVTSDGTIYARAAGTAVIEVHAYGLVAATPVTVGTADERLLEFFPRSYALPVGGQRQFLVRERVPATVVDLSSAAAGTRYYVANPSLGSISADGLFTSLAAGETLVTIVSGGQSVVVPIVAEAPAAGAVVIGPEGGLVASGTGITVGVPAGALDEPQAFSVRSIVAGELPYSLPTGWTFAAGFDIDWNGQLGDHPFSIEMPAPAGSQPGDVLYLFQPATAYLEGGRSEPTWMLADTVRVGSDGKMRTTSPPNVGVGSRTWEGAMSTLLVPSAAGFGAVASGSAIGLLFGMADLSTRQRSMQSQYGEVVSADVSPGGGNGETRFYVASGPLGDVLVPALADFRYQFTVHQASPVGLRRIGSTEVQIAAGQVVSIGLPQAPRVQVRADRIVPPTITRARVEIGDRDHPEPRVILTGHAFTVDNPHAGAPSALGASLADLTVTFQIGGLDRRDAQGNLVPVGGRDYRVPGSQLSLGATTTENGVQLVELIVPLPPNALLGPASVTVTRPMFVPTAGRFSRQEFTSNPVSFAASGNLVLVADGAEDKVSVIDVTKTATVLGAPKLKPEEVARIPLGINLPLVDRLAPRKILFNKQGTLAYVTLENGAGISVIDALALHEVDVNPNTFLEFTHCRPR